MSIPIPGHLVRRLLPMCAVALVTQAPSAQCPPSTGPLAGVPTVFSLSQATGSFRDDALYGKATGFHAIAPPRAGVPGGPTFDLQQILSACTTLPVILDVDAVSSGADWILADDATGRVQVPADRWGALTFSVTRGTRGRPGTVIRDEVGRADGAAADVFSYLLPGSAVPLELVGRTQRAVDSREIDLGDGADIDALDNMLPLFGLEPGIVSLMPNPPRIYFSLTSASASAAPASWFGPPGPSGATILMVTYNSRLRTWNCPQPYRSFRDMGLAQEEDLDALAIDVANQRILFSTRTPTRNPILFLSTRTDLIDPLPYSDVDAIPISSKIGLLEDDDVDAVCALDPSIRSQGSGGNPFYYTAGTPRPTAIHPWTPGLDASVFRGRQGAGATFETFLTGWPANGARPGVAALFVSLPDSLNPLVTFGVVQRGPVGPFCGAPVRFELPIPPGLTLSAQPLFLRWFAADDNFHVIGEAHPLQIRL